MSRRPNSLHTEPKMPPSSDFGDQSSDFCEVLCFPLGWPRRS